MEKASQEHPERDSPGGWFAIPSEKARTQPDYPQHGLETFLGPASIYSAQTYGIATIPITSMPRGSYEIKIQVDDILGRTGTLKAVIHVE